MAEATVQENQPQPTISAPAENKGALTLRQAIDEVSAQFDAEAESIAPALPPTIPIDRFKSVVIWALNSDPDLLRADRRSLLNACIKAANDGLVPDKKEGALVTYNCRVKTKMADGLTQDVWKRLVQWMPMVYGITKKALGSGCVLSLYAMVVYQKEIDEGRFHYKISDGRHCIDHEPILIEDPGPPVLSYAVAITADNIVEVQPMTLRDIQKVRRVSRSKDKDGNPTGPWKDWEDEMWKKSAVRRLSKRIPFPPETERVIRRDDEMIDFDQDQDDGDDAPLTQNVTQAAALMGGSGFPAAAPGASAPMTIEGDISGEMEGDAADQAGQAEDNSEPVETPSEEPTLAELIDRVKPFGREAAAKGTAELRKWWNGLDREVQLGLQEFKDKELKPEAAKADAKVEF